MSSLRILGTSDLPGTSLPPPAEKPLSMEAWLNRNRSSRRFHIGIRAYMLAITVLGAAVGFGVVDLAGFGL